MTDLIQYPWDEAPDYGCLQQISNGVQWLRLPLPMKLDHVNIYILDDGDGWTIIDSGMKWGGVEEMWQNLLAGPLSHKPVNRIVATHHHPDHIGFTGWFVSKFGAKHISTQTAYLMGRMLTLDVQDEYNSEQIAFYRRAGMPADLMGKRIQERPFNFADMVHPIPLGFQSIGDGDVIKMGGRRWDIHIGHGHAPHHATFWSRDDNLVLSGDQIIPSISSNIGVYPTEPEANPLHDWLQSCAKFKTIACDDHQILPGHKMPFTGAGFRLDQLIENHHGALQRLRADLKTPKSAHQVFMAIFKREISGGEYGLALVEALAHCIYLWHAGEVDRTIGDDGAYLWQMK